MGNRRRRRRLRVVCTQELAIRAEQQRLEEHFDVVVSTENLAADLATADGAIIIVPARADEDLLRDAPRLRALATVSSGTDHIHLETLAARGIRLISGSGSAPAPVAEWVAWAALSLRRQLHQAAKLQEAGVGWIDAHQEPPPGLGSATLGLIGFGRTGQHVHRYLAPFVGRTLTLTRSPRGLPSGCEHVADVTDLCMRSDIVSLHVPLTDQTHGLLGETQLRAIGPEGVLINAARGAVVDQQALLACLQDGSLGAAAIDCYEPEPPDPGFVRDLASTGRALLTPHIAGFTRDGLETLCRVAVDGLIDALLTDPPDGRQG